MNALTVLMRIFVLIDLLFVLATNVVFFNKSIKIPSRNSITLIFLGGVCDCASAIYIADCSPDKRSNPTWGC